MTSSHLSIAASFLLFFLLWYALSKLSGLPPFILPEPERVLRTVWVERWQLIFHASVTSMEIIIGLGLSTILGFCSAVSLASSRFLRVCLKPILILSQSMPLFALAPLLTLWMGYGIWPKITIAILITYFPITSLFLDGLMQTPQQWLDLGKVMGGSPWRIMWYIRIPAALPSFASGLRLAAIYAPTGAVIGEWVGASQGLGYLMLIANGRARTDLMFAALLVLIILTFVLHSIISKIFISKIFLRFLDNERPRNHSPAPQRSTFSAPW